MQSLAENNIYFSFLRNGKQESNLIGQKNVSFFLDGKLIYSTENFLGNIAIDKKLAIDHILLTSDKALLSFECIDIFATFVFPVYRTVSTIWFCGKNSDIYISKIMSTTPS